MREIEPLYSAELDGMVVGGLYVENGEIFVIDEDELVEKVYPPETVVTYKRFTPAKMKNLQDLKNILNNKKMVCTYQTGGYFVSEPEGNLLDDDSYDYTHGYLGEDILSLIGAGCIGTFSKEYETTLIKFVKLVGIEEN